MATTANYTVTGMTCGHCASAVAKEVGGVAGVTNVEVDVDTGRVAVTSDQPVAADDVRAAVQEAGYEVTGAA